MKTAHLHFCFGIANCQNIVKIENSSLQCYNIISTIAQVLRKMSLKILVSWFLMPHLSQTFESYQRVKIYTYSVIDLGLKSLKNFSQ